MAAERRVRVLMTADTVGGVWHYALELTAALAQHEVQVALATMGAPLTSSQREQIEAVPNASLHESAYRLEWMSEPWSDLTRAGAWLLELEREFLPDVVHLNQFAFGVLPFNAPKLIVAHSCVLSWWSAVRGTAAPPEWDRYRATVRDGLAHAALTVAPTRAMLESLRENYGYDGPALVIGNGRSGRRYAPAPKEPVILAAGRLWDEGKNFGALESIAPELPWPVLFAGSTAAPGGSVRETRGVRELGELAPEALAREYARASIYALPARYEPFGLSVLEAALSGCALVLGDIPSLREIWADTAIYVRPDDPASLRASLLWLIADEPLRTRHALASRRRALEMTPERQARAYIDAYARICDRGTADWSTNRSREEARACVS